MMEHLIEETLAACKKIAARNYSPKQMFRFTRLVLYGDTGIGVGGTQRKRICPTDHKFEHAAAKGPRLWGDRWYCVECGGYVHLGAVCHNCGTDNHYAIQLGLAKKVEEENK